MRARQSPLPVAKFLPEGLTATLMTEFLCPCSIRCDDAVRGSLHTSAYACICVDVVIVLVSDILIHCTRYTCISSMMIDENVHSPCNEHTHIYKYTYQNCTERSLEPETSQLPSGENATDNTKSYIHKHKMSRCRGQDKHIDSHFKHSLLDHLKEGMHIIPYVL